MSIRSLTWCTVFASRCTAYAIMYIRKHTWVYCIPHQVYNRHHVNQEPHLVELYLPTGVLHMPSCTSGSTLRCTAFPSKSTAAIMCIRSLTWCTVFASRCTAYAIMYITRQNWVYYIPHHVSQEPHFVYCICICYHVHQEAHWWTVFPTKFTTDIMLIRSLT